MTCSINQYRTCLYIWYIVSVMNRDVPKKTHEKLLKTMTYELLQDQESGLYAESHEYVWSMLQDEENGNIASWMKG